MKKILIDESQKNEILQQHQSLKESLVETVNERIKDYKRILSEQANPIFIDNRTIQQTKADCTKAGSNSLLTLFKGKPAIKVVGGPDDIRIYTNEPNTNFGGYNYYILNTAETKILKGPYSWTCKAKVQPQVDPNADDIKREMATGNWIERSKINVPDSELVQLYDQHPKYKNLWALKQGQGKKAGFDDNQQAFVDAWTKENPDAAKKLETEVYKINPTAADFATGRWTKDNYFVAPGSEGFFPADENGVKGLKIFYNISKVSTEPTRENCRVAIKDFVDKYKKHLGGVEPDAQEFATQKALVKLCKSTVKFGGPLSKIDDYLKLLAGYTTNIDGMEIKGPSASGVDKIWLIR